MCWNCILISFLFVSVLQSGEASVFEVNIRYVGGLLSAYYLTGEEVRSDHAYVILHILLHHI